MGRGTPEFITVYKEINRLRDAAIVRDNKFRINSAVQFLNENPKALFQLIGVQGDHFGDFWETPIEKLLSPNVIAKYFKNNPHEKCADLYSAINSRYRFSNHKNHGDKKWLMDCAEKIKRLANGRNRFEAAKFRNIYSRWFLASADRCSDSISQENSIQNPN